MRNSFIAFAVVILFAFPATASAQIFGSIPDILDRTRGTGPVRTGSWSIRPMMPLGNGYRTGNPTTYSPEPRQEGRMLFGRIPRTVPQEGFGYIPTLSDLFGPQ